MSAQNPLVICGPPRTGTRFLAEAINRHPKVVVQGELAPPVLRHLLTFVRKTDEYYNGEGKKWKSQWLLRRKELIEDMIYGAQKYPSELRKNGISGFKFPRSIYQWRKIVRMYGPTTFIFCIRSFRSQYLSAFNRWPEKTIEKRAELYLRAVEEALAMLDEPKVQLAIFSLDVLKKDPNHLLDVFRRINLPDAEETAQKTQADKRENVGKNPNMRSELTSEEESYIAAHPELDARVGELWAAYEKNLSTS